MNGQWFLELGNYAGALTAIVGLIEMAMKIREHPGQNWRETLKITGLWIFWVVISLGLPSVACAFGGAALGQVGSNNVNIQFQHTVSYVATLTTLYGIFWGAVLRPWLAKHPTFHGE